MPNSSAHLLLLLQPLLLLVLVLPSLPMELQQAAGTAAVPAPACQQPLTGLVRCCECC
jgi:hypothetical protein